MPDGWQRAARRRARQVACERALENSGLPYTILRASHFMESLPDFVRGPDAQILGTQRHRYHYVAVEDYARMVAAALDEPAAANKAFTIFGPSAYTIPEALRVYLDRVHPGLEIKTAPLPVMRLVARLTGNGELAAEVQLFEALADLGEEGDPALANPLLGAPRITLEEWSRRRG